MAEISLVKAIVSLGPCAYCGCGLQALAMPTTSTVTIHASERWSLPRYTINHLKVEIRASLVSERVGHLGFDISIYYQLIYTSDISSVGFYHFHTSFHFPTAMR